MITAVNTEKHEYVVIEDYPYHVRETHFFFFFIRDSLQYLPCVPPANKTIRHSHVALIGSQYSTVTVSRYYFRINRISDRIRYSNTGIDPDSWTTRLQRRIHTRIMDYDCGILCFQVRVPAKIIIYIQSFPLKVTTLILLKDFFHKFKANFVLGRIIFFGFNIHSKNWKYELLNIIKFFNKI